MSRRASAAASKVTIPVTAEFAPGDTVSNIENVSNCNKIYGCRTKAQLKEYIVPSVHWLKHAQAAPFAAAVW